MSNDDIEERLREKGVKSTSNRINVYRVLSESRRPMSLSDLEGEIATMDKSSIFRVLILFQQHDVVHTIDDGSGSLKYEICHAEHHCHAQDMHVHFYCERCQQVTCLDDLPVPQVPLPPGYSRHTVNYIVKGVCPKCRLG